MDIKAHSFVGQILQYMDSHAQTLLNWADWDAQHARWIQSLRFCWFLVCVIYSLINKVKSPSPKCNKCWGFAWRLLCAMNIHLFEKFKTFTSSLFCWTNGEVAWGQVCVAFTVWAPSGLQNALCSEASVFGCVCKGRLAVYVYLCCLPAGWGGSG